MKTDEIICVIIGVALSLWISFSIGNGDWLNKPEKVTRYTQITITPEAMKEMNERLANAAGMNNQVRELRDAIYQRANIDDLRLLREIHAAEEKTFTENMRK